MRLVKLAVKYPIAITACVVMLIMFGIIALNKIPIQLTPDINRPIITITTIWPGAAPAEIEREIISRQEEVLKGLDGLTEITSSAVTGIATITLEFDIQQNMNHSLLLVSNRLDRVNDYPSAEIDKPILQTAGSDDSPIAWFALKKLTPEATNIDNYRHLAEDLIQDRLERLPGVARVNIYGGGDVEVQVIVDAENLAYYRLTLQELVASFDAANISISAGDIEEGKRRYVVRTEAEFKTLEQIENVVIRSQTNKFGQIERILAKDVAKIKFGFAKPNAMIRHMGEPTIVINAIREHGANVIKVMKEVKATLTDINKTLASHNLELKQVYDETTYIDSAIDLVQQNIFIGGLLAAGILFLFLNSTRTVLIILLSIPISVLGAFVAMAAFGKSINVISLAGLAFAVGMVVDAAIIVLENIYRHLQRGVPVKEAAVKGTIEVWGAIFVSALTTIAVFLPIIVGDLEISQLFRDIALAIAVAVAISLLVAITFIPALAVKLFAKQPDAFSFTANSKRFLWGQTCSQKIMAYLEKSFAQKKFALINIILIGLVAVLLTWLLLPKLEYLPEGNRNIVFGSLLPPPGYNLATTTEIAKHIEQAAEPLWVQNNNNANDPRIKNFFFVSMENTAFVGAIAEDPTKVRQLIPIISKPIFQEPGTYGFVTQASLFGRSVRSGRTIELDVSGPDLEKILDVALRAMMMVQELLPMQQGHQYRPVPGLELGAPEIRVIPDNTLIADNKLNNQIISYSMKVFNDKLRVATLNIAGKRIDMQLMGAEDKIKATQDVNDVPIVTPSGKILPLKSLAKVIYTAGPVEIRRKNYAKTVTIEIRPSNLMPLETAMGKLQQEVIAKLQPQIAKDNISLRLSGTADKLSVAWDSLKLELLTALVIVYLIMAVLFESFFYPMLIMFSVPIAAAGGVLGLAVLNLFTNQPLDMLTMLGFIILIGIVVNNAILIVHHTLKYLREDKMPIHDAVLQATKYRIRPIFMSTLTSIFGMLPLVLSIGAGSELYRGLGSVIVGGLSLSSILTLIIIPILLRFSLQNKVSPS